MDKTIMYHQLSLLAGLLILLMLTPILNAQNTVGLISYKAAQVSDGYNLIYPHNQPNVYLINNCGEIVHQWDDTPDMRPANTAYLLEDGNLVKASRPANVTNDPIWAGGGGATVSIVDWENNPIWSYTLNNDTARLHHDIAVIENNDQLSILMVAWELKTREEAIQAGRDSTLLSQGELWPDHILEIVPETGEIIWEWYAWDHLIQDFDETKDNYGVISENPNKIDINLALDDAGNADWMHVNSIDYDPANDQILLSVPYFDEIWIIDHSTTLEQSATSSGGRGNRGGDLLYRWGNPMNYDQGEAVDQELFFQHDARYIDDFVEIFDPNYGKISVFNNRLGTDYSGFGVLDAPFDMYDWAFAQSDGAFLPESLELSFTHPDTTAVYSTGLSSVQYLANGNYLICSGRQGYLFELTPANEVVWEYIVPLQGGSAVDQGTELMINNNLNFRVIRYPVDYAAFDNRELSSKGYIETNPDTEYCDQLLPLSEINDRFGMDIYPNPASDMITITWEQGMYISIKIFDTLGRTVFDQDQINGGRKYINTSDWRTGMYLININGVESAKLLIQND